MTHEEALKYVRLFQESTYKLEQEVVALKKELDASSKDFDRVSRSCAYWNNKAEEEHALKEILNDEVAVLKALVKEYDTVSDHCPMCGEGYGDVQHWSL